MKIFYSWQSDTPREIGKDFIREALDIAASSGEINEANRPTIDQDTSGVLGSPPIADTILRKITESQIVVVDVTLIGQTESGKRLVNSNVAIELGYALGVHNDKVLLCVMNTHFGSPEALPFDLVHRRWPVRFALPANPSRAERQNTLERLADELRKIIEAYGEAHRSPPELFSPTPSTVDAASYWQLGEILAKFGDARQGEHVSALKYNFGGPLIYLRIWPHEKIQSLSAEVLNDYEKSVIEPLCGTPHGWSHVRNRYGRLTCAFSADDPLVLSSTQVLRSGEIWGVNRHLLLPRGGRAEGIIPVGAFQQGFERSLGAYIGAALNDFGYQGHIHVEFGLINVAGFKLALPSGDLSDEIFEDVKLSTVVDNTRPSSVRDTLRETFRVVYESGGMKPP
jgi:hypothetical protein